MKKILFVLAFVLLAATLMADSMRGTAPSRFQACDGTTRKVRRIYPNARIHGCHCRRMYNGRFDCTVDFSRPARWVHDSMRGTAPSRFQACDGTTRKVRRTFPEARIHGCHCRRMYNGRFDCTVDFERRP